MSFTLRERKVKLFLWRAVEVRGAVGRRGSRIFWTVGSRMEVGLSALRVGRPLPPGRFWFMFLLGAECITGPWCCSGVGSVEESSELVGGRARDLPACGMVPQHTMQPHLSYAVQNIMKHTKFNFISTFENQRRYERLRLQKLTCGVNKACPGIYRSVLFCGT
jgi:hypothetical protein